MEKIIDFIVVALVLWGIVFSAWMCTLECDSCYLRWLKMKAKE